MNARWIVDATVEVILARGSADWLVKFADQVPPAYVSEFHEHLGAVVRELTDRGEHGLAAKVASKTLRAMSAERWRAAVLALVRGKLRRYRRFLKQSQELDREAARAAHWEAEVENTRRAVARLLEKAAEMAEGDAS